MLPITVKQADLFDDELQMFIPVKTHTLRLEHSLVSLSKWESKWHKPFLANTEKTYEETIDYIRCMNMTQNTDPMVFRALTDDQIRQINDYIDNPMTATTVPDIKNGPPSREQVTSELIYYWMVALNIPFECEKWHLNRLLTLIKVTNFKNQPPKKMSKSEILSRNRALNEARKKKFHTKG